MTYVVEFRNKAARYPVGHGYSTRPYTPSAIVVHSTEGAKGQSLESAADYLYNASGVSAHFLIGKAGEIIQFLDTRPWAAWHAGGKQTDGTWTAQPAFDNSHSIGIECLHAFGETWPDAQCGALSWLLQQLVKSHGIAVPMVDTHGQIALPGPYQRKVDPTNWAHADFITWRDKQLAAPANRRYTVVAPCAVLTDRQGSAALAGGPDNGQTQLMPGDQINVGDCPDCGDDWLWVSSGPNADPGIGFIPSSYARPA